MHDAGIAARCCGNASEQFRERDPVAGFVSLGIVFVHHLYAYIESYINFVYGIIVYINVILEIYI